MGLTLGSPNPHTTNVGAETLGFRSWRFSLQYTLLMPAFALVIAPPSPCRDGFNAHTTLPYHSYHKIQVSEFGLLFEPRWIFGALFLRLVSCYAFFKGWLLLSRPPRCLRNNTSFPTEQILETLVVDLGCFPFASGA